LLEHSVGVGLARELPDLSPVKIKIEKSRVKLPTVADNDGRLGLSAIGALALELEEHGQRLLGADAPERNVLVVHPLALDEADVEPGPVAVGPAVHHAQHAGACTRNTRAL